MKVKEQLSRIVNDMLSLKRLNLKELYFLTETNDLNNLIELTHTLVKIVKGNDKPQLQPRSFTDLMSGVPAEEQPQAKPASTQAMELFTEEDCIMMLNIMFILKEKLSSTIYQWIIKDAASEFMNKIKLLKCSESMRKEVINQMTKSFLDDNYLDPEKEDQVRSLVKSGLLQNIDSIVSRFENLIEVYNFFYLKVLPLLTTEMESTKPKDKYTFLKNALAIIRKFFFPLEIEIHMQKNSLSESRRFKPTTQTEFLRSYSRILQGVGKLFNQIILSPSDVELQTSLFIILRRMYFLWGNPVRNPLFCVIVNISLYSNNEQSLKAAAIFCYKIMTQKTDLQLTTLIDNCQHLKFIKDSPYYSSKAYAYMNDVCQEMNSADLSLPFFKLRKTVECGDQWHYNVIVEKSSSLLTWQFNVVSHDIGFGLFKTENMGKLEISDYQAQKNCKAVVKMSKYASGKPHKGWLFLKSGTYRFVFDNTYSYIRYKDILYSFHLLEQI